jgi:predicted HicB family RNase H-like nuclease
MQKTKRLKTETLNLRVGPEFKARLAEEARKSRRSITNYVEATFMELWERKEQDREKRNRTA